MNIAVLAATFEAPSTKDFVYGCWGGSVKLFGFSLCLNFVTFLVILTFGIMILLFYLAFREPTVVPGKLQTMMELGVQFVREQIAIPVLGPDADRFMPLLASLFFFILIGNLFEVVPLVNFSANSSGGPIGRRSRSMSSGRWTVGATRCLRMRSASSRSSVM